MANKKLGQHFLNDAKIAADIVDAANLRSSDNVWEIGPGLGILTEQLYSKNVNIRAYEIDTRLFNTLCLKYNDEVTLFNQDILQIDWKKQIELTKHDGSMLKLVANLPYQITAPILSLLEEHCNDFELIVLMVQKEVADRLTAKAGSKAYGVLTLKLQLVFDIEKLFDVYPQSFNPMPKVISSVIRLRPRQKRPYIHNLKLLHKLIVVAFSHRRKTLRNNLKMMLNKDQIASLEDKYDLDRRGETFCETDFIHLSDDIAHILAISES